MTRRRSSLAVWVVIARPVAAQTTVNVNMVEYAFQLSQSSMPSGQVTFVIKNSGNEIHNFAILGNKAGAQIGPGTSETWTVSLPPGTYNYICDVPFHAERGMTGQFTVTPYFIPSLFRYENNWYAH